MMRSIHALGVSFLESTLGLARALTISSLERPLLAYSVEKLWFEKSDDFICDLSGITYCSYEWVAEVA